MSHLSTECEVAHGLTGWLRYLHCLWPLGTFEKLSYAAVAIHAADGSAMVWRKLTDDGKHMDCSRVFASRMDCIADAFEQAICRRKVRNQSACAQIVRRAQSDSYMATIFVGRSQVDPDCLQGLLPSSRFVV